MLGFVCLLAVALICWLPFDKALLPYTDKPDDVCLTNS